MSPNKKVSDLPGQRLIQSTKKMWLLFVIISSVSIVLFAFDKEIMILIEKEVSAELIAIAEFLQYYGNIPFYLTFAFLLVYSLIKKNLKLKQASWAYIKAQVILSFVLIRVLKIFFGRLRPKYGSAFTFFSLDFTKNSFPSGHATDAFVSGVFLFYLLKHSRYSTFRFLPLIYAAIIALSRIACYAHFPSDVMIGIALGVFGSCYFIARLSVQPAGGGQMG